MRTVMTATLLSLWLGSAGAAHQPGPGPEMVRRMPGPIAPPQFRGSEARLAMTFEQGIPVVEVLVNGRGPYRFAVDTGAAGHGRIRPAIAEALGLNVAGEMTAGDGSGRRQARRTFVAYSVAVGGITFSEVRFSEMPVLPGRLESVDGILGLQLFGRHLLTLDYPGQRLALSTGGLPTSAISYTSPRGLILVPVTIGGTRIEAQIDTGNAVAPLIVPEATAQLLPRAGEPRRAGVARTAMSTIEMWEADLPVPVLIGNVTVPVRSVRYPALGEYGNLGSLALRSAVVQIDQRNSRISFSFAPAGRGR